MTPNEFGSLTLFLFLILAAARLLGDLFALLRQPRVIGEILAGVLVGPSLLGHLAPHLSVMLLPQAEHSATSYAAVLMFLYNFGLLLLMFVSGAETKGLFNRENRREVAWLGAVGTGLPFLLALGMVPFLPVEALAGRVTSRTPLLLVVSIGVAVTSIPVISKILHDLQILHTRFARLILSVAVIEDVVLWAVLAVATALAESGTIPRQKIAVHIAVTLLYFGAGLLLGPRLVGRLTAARWNSVAQKSPTAYVIVLLLAYAALAAVLDISLVFAAFLAGYAIVKTENSVITASIASISDFAFAAFIPIYFAVVGYRLDLSKSFSFTMLVIFLAGSSLVKLFSAGLGARLAGFRTRNAVNLAMTLNARGGPGIVLASVALDAGIINARFYTAMVLTAILTSQAAGTWLAYLLRKGRPLLEGQNAQDVVGLSREPTSELAA
jgi:Kef-type K+ transport system membrane component KefB